VRLEWQKIFPQRYLHKPPHHRIFAGRRLRLGRERTG